MTNTFDVLKGKSLGAAIKGREKVAATFAAREHQLAYSALVHVDEHHDVIYLNRLYAVTPANYRYGLMMWAKEFGKCRFDSKTREFVFSKGKKSDLKSALNVAPANYKPAKGDNSEPAAFDEIKALEKFIERCVDKDASPTMVHGLQQILKAVKRPAVVADNSQKADTAAKAEQNAA